MLREEEEDKQLFNYGSTINGTMHQSSLFHCSIDILSLCERTITPIPSFFYNFLFPGWPSTAYIGNQDESWEIKTGGLILNTQPKGCRLVHQNMRPAPHTHLIRWKTWECISFIYLFIYLFAATRVDTYRQWRSWVGAEGGGGPEGGGGHAVTIVLTDKNGWGCGSVHSRGLIGFRSASTRFCTLLYTGTGITMHRLFLQGKKANFREHYSS